MYWGFAVKKFKRSAYSVAAVAALALTMQAPAAAGGHERGVEFALRQALNLQNGDRRNRDRLFLQNGELTGSRKENRVLRMQNRLGIDTAVSVSGIQAQRSAAHLIRINNVDLNGLPSDLNLRSKRDNYVLSNLSGSVTITRGGQDVVVNGNTKLTAAEIAAVYQVLNDGGQSLALGRKGDAEGGNLTLDAAAVSGLTGLSIPKNVTITGDFTSASQLGIGGDLRNAGNLVVRSNDPSIAAATITAANIRNTRTGSIGTVDAGSKPIDLNLFASVDIVNQGRISGGGNVNLAAGGAIYNVREPGSSATDPAPSIVAGRNLSLQSSMIANNGLISATAGNINIADQLQSGVGNNFIAINAQGGTFSATNGDITIGNNSFVQTDKIVMSGGDYFSKTLNLNAGVGSINGTIGDVTGLVKTSAGVAHVGVSAETLNLGQSVISGDPTFFNDAGGIRISGNLDYAESIALLASGTIDDDSIFPFLIRAQDGTGEGHNITIIAGAKLTAAGGAQPTSFAEMGTNREITQGTVKVSGASKSGGNVNLTKTTITSAGSGAGGGGDVTVVAYANKTGGGVVNISSIQASGAAGKNGNVSIYAGANVGQAIIAPSITTGDGAGAAGNILLSNSQAKVKMTFDKTGTGVGSISAGKKLALGGIDARSITAHGGNIEIDSAAGVALGFTGTTISTDGLAKSDAGSITVRASEINMFGVVQAIGGDGTNGLPNGGSGTNGGAGGDISLTATNGRINWLDANAFISSQGGKGGDGATATGAGVAGGSGGHGGKSGNISLTATSDLNVGANGILTRGGDAGVAQSGAGGDITATSGGAGGSGGNGGGSGNITLVSNFGLLNIGGLVSTVGGAGSDAAAGGAADVVTSGASGGIGGAGGIGGNSGNIEIRNTSNDINLNANVLSTSGVSGRGGDGGAGSSVGAAAGAGANGSNSGNIAIANGTGGIIFGSGIAVGTAARFGGAGGTGGQGNNGGNGADGGLGGKGGDAGQITITNSTKSLEEISGDASNLIYTVAGAGGRGGNGGAGGGQGNGIGGNGGNGGNSSGSGKNGSISMSGAKINFLGLMQATHFSGKASGGTGGAGGAMTGDVGGNGGTGGTGGPGVVGGTITVTGGTVNLGTLDVAGSQGGGGGFGGAPGTAGGATDGNAGSGGTGGIGGQGGLISVSGVSIGADLLFASGGAGGNGGIGNDAGTTTASSLNGNGGASGAQGAGGKVVLFTKGKGTPDITVNTITANAGNTNSSGSGGTTLNRNGGAVGAVGASAIGGSVDIQSARNVNLTNVSVVGGNGGIVGIAGPSAAGGVGVSGGTGGTILVKTKKGDFTSVNAGTINFSGGIGSNGGSSGSAFTGSATTGSTGGNAGTFTISTKGTTTLAGAVLGAGGTGGVGGGNAAPQAGGVGGVGGVGGNLLLTATAANLSNVTLSGGVGGTGAVGGSNVEQTGGAGGEGGLGGVGGKFSLVKMKGPISLVTLTASGGAGGVGGTGGSGGNSVQAVGKAGGVGGTGGKGGVGGQIQLLTRGTVTTAGGVIARGGDGGDGGLGGAAGFGSTLQGVGGAGGDGGYGGQGGLIAGSSVVPGADANGGLGGSGGVGGAGNPGGSGGIGGQSGQNGTITP